MSPPPHRGPVRLSAFPRPIAVGLYASGDIARAGLTQVLAAYGTRVQLQSDDPRRPAQVEILDIAHDAVPEVPLATCPRIVLCWDVSPRVVYRAQALGASRLFRIDLPAGDLVHAIEVVHREPTAPHDLAAPESAWDSGPYPLSPRESAVLARICAGLSNQEIAGELYLSMNTVKTYIRTCYGKIGADSRSRAVLWGLDHGF